MEELSRRIPHATFATMNSNHGGHEERPSEFLRQVEPFISWFAVRQRRLVRIQQAMASGF